MFSIFRRKKTGGLEKAEVVEKPQTGQDPLEARLGRTRSHLAELFGVVRSASRIDDSLLEDIETTLLTADLGVAATTRIMDKLAEGIKAGVVEKSGSWFSYDSVRIGQGRENAKKFLKENPEIAQGIEAKLRELLLPKKKKKGEEAAEPAEDSATAEAGDADLLSGDAPDDKSGK